MTFGIDWSIIFSVKTTNTRQILLETGKQLIWEKGYTATGILDVLQAANVPKGSFYHYFKSKDVFVLVVLDSYAQEHYTHVGHHLEDETLTPLSRLHRFFTAAGHWFESMPAYRGCMVGNLSQELGAYNEDFRSRLQAMLDQLRSNIQLCLQQAQDCGELPAQMPIEQMADFCLSGLHGALLRMKVSQNPAPLHAFLAILFDRVLVN